MTTEDPPETNELNLSLQSRRLRDEFKLWLEMMNDVGIIREEVAVPAITQMLTDVFVSTRPHAGILAPMGTEIEGYDQ